VKNTFRNRGGLAKFWALKGDSMEFGRNWMYMPHQQLLLALLDLHNTLGHTALGNHVE
jgi:hypothetical protein